jgi:hypothetical protein
MSALNRCLIHPSSRDHLQWLATDEVGPSADFAGDTFLAGQLSVHALGEKLSSLNVSISIIQFRTGKKRNAYLWLHE